MIFNKRKSAVFLVITLLLLMTTLLASHSLILSSANSDEDIANRVLCRFEDGKQLANLRSTDYLYYKFRSKSAMASVQGVNSSLPNKLLSVAGYNFDEVNQLVLGRELSPSSIPEGSATNGGVKVSAFDRFGMSGLNWSSYQGEWKYNHVDACRSGQISPTTYGSYYQGRLEPQSTHNEVSTSKDPRTIQFNKGLFSLISTGLTDLIANFLFSIAKGIVTLTIVFVGLAFSDITSLMGLSAEGTAGITSTGLFSTLYNTIFQSFVVFAIIFTAIYIIYKGLIKRQLRLAVGTLVKTVAIFLVATIMSTNPSYWIGIPNKIATYGQAIVLSSMAGVYDSEGAPTLCSTEVGSISEGVDFEGATDEASIKTQLEKTNDNMRSLIGCQMWEVLLFRPWVRGQFGAEYEDLDSKALGNVNSEWVGEGEVLMGDGETIKNWALFHLSTQTDAHAEAGGNNFNTIVTGVNADWWRTADALSNYDEGEVSDSIDNQYNDTYIEQTSFTTTDYWQSWVGNNSTQRIGTAFMAICFAIVGSIAPLFFAFSSAVYGLGITLLMIISPLFFLFGTWGGKGDPIFFGWLSSLGNTILKRIGVSILLIISIVITLNIMNLVYTIGFVKSFILMVIVTIVLVKNKEKLLSMIASIDIGANSFNPANKARQLIDQNKERAGDIGKIGLATGAGAIAGHKTGQGARSGATTAATNQARNTLYKSMLGVNIIREMDIMVESERKFLNNCVMCYAILGQKGEEVAYRDDEGNYYCINCAEEIGLEVVYEVSVGSDQGLVGQHEEISYTRTVPATKNRSHITHEQLKNSMKPSYNNGEYNWDTKGVQKMVKDNLYNLGVDAVVFKNLQDEIGRKRRPPIAPEPLHSYIDIALLNLAWTNGNHEAVNNTYKEAWKAWYTENAKHVEDIDQEDIDKFIREIDDFTVEINAEEATEFLDRDTVDLRKNKIIEEDSGKNLYIYKNGRLVLNDYD